MKDSPPIERLREHYQDPAPGIRSGDDCPPAETPLRLVLGELKGGEARHFADHAGRCPACASAWRFARIYAEEAGLAASTGGGNGRRRWVAVAGLAAAAALVGFFLWLPHQPDFESGPLMRAPDRSAVQSRIEDGASLPVDRFVLHWSAAAEGTRYDVRVTDASLRRVAGVVSLAESEYQVPVEALADLVDGDLILWQVDVVLPDGSRSTSSTFSVRVARP